MTSFSFSTYLTIDISEKSKPHAWEKLPWRWVVERTLGWLNPSRWLSKDYEIAIASALALLQLSLIHTLLKRLLILPLISYNRS